jgi:methylase of polypeptide subunit release factors
MKQLEIAHLLWERHLKGKQSCVIDATCGNGHDALFLASLPMVSLHCIDVQKEAIEATKKRLLSCQNVSFYQKSHNDLSFIKGPVDLIVYNLGYLPGSDKTIVTTPKEVIASLDSALLVLKDDGLISLMIYTGHAGGNEERAQILDYFNSIEKQWAVCHISHPFKRCCPEILMVERCRKVPLDHFRNSLCSKK